MNFFLTDIPDRTKKPRENGLTMMMDKGLSINDTKNFIDMCGPHTDIIKLGFGTSSISPNVEKKIELYQSSGRVFREGSELFNETSWLAVMHGQGIKTEAYHPLVDVLSPEEIHQRLMNIHSVIEQSVASMPQQKKFIDDHCRAK